MSDQPIEDPFATVPPAEDPGEPVGVADPEDPPVEEEEPALGGYDPTPEELAAATAPLEVEAPPAVEEAVEKLEGDEGEDETAVETSEPAASFEQEGAAIEEEARAEMAAEVPGPPETPEEEPEPLPEDPEEIPAEPETEDEVRAQADADAANAEPPPLPEDKYDEFVVGGGDNPSTRNRNYVVLEEVEVVHKGERRIGYIRVGQAVGRNGDIAEGRAIKALAAAREAEQETVLSVVAERNWHPNKRRAKRNDGWTAD